MRVFLILVLLACSTNILACPKFKNQELEQIAKKFLTLKNRLQQPDPTEDDINKFLGLFATDVDIEMIFPDIKTVNRNKNEFYQRILTDINNEFESSELLILETISGFNFVVKMLDRSKHKGKSLLLR
ncbi:hypothetical protein [Glaciecola sp. 1036]|uniref:hypothetical protein n=1 Tax=Alteromonadaceae TaxID=72275 RepID=UPI003CFF7548